MLDQSFKPTRRALLASTTAAGTMLMFNGLPVLAQDGGTLTVAVQGLPDSLVTGFSSFASLNDVGASYLKIDGRFVRSLSDQASSTTVIRTINVLAHELGMECIADSVDDAGTLALVRKLGADYGQGAALCPPLPLAEFEAACASGRLPHSPAFRRALDDARGAGAKAPSTLPAPVV